ncbi:mycofactocin system transcriptional regulator [Mycolicibacterium diernhoferi]|uniref:Mycofactocin system transcriptional regulator n=1 Tax=Mycolicibacterium diernhoferi TaxID=1801 RepID=A0A1Q4HEF8_9MYCO|nr:mycofactocin system transcriptional regulator [Mycolicibacterium diernhoferi]OJZ65934.1 mycofactocin system transcriptional regulator [Mycolicibacterium diernhoferi]OPE54010.1 mycofactocin system transcriptional regulator [Mycolicibacterium diernhoferi]PEG53307.1 mycofactocin system transcriptional regulator [Mycolicibacterium diernhoferi]QYL23842.1 mycofactocin system transcriptional regulator [Mycolicibacterium diernhoferi]
MTQVSGHRVGRRPSTTQDHITAVALDLFASRGFDEVSVDDVARAAGIARRTLFRYYPSKNAIPWGDFDAHLNLMRALLAKADPQMGIGEALRTALLAFNEFDDKERHRQRMRLILGTDALQAHSMTMYAGWRGVVAEFVARRRGEEPDGLVPQTVAWSLLGVALTAYEQWLADESASLHDLLGESFDVVGRGLSDL